MRTGSAILVFFIVLKVKKFSHRTISSHAWLAIFIYILKFYEDITKKATLMITFNKYILSKMFREKNESGAL